MSELLEALRRRVDVVTLGPAAPAAWIARELSKPGKSTWGPVEYDPKGEGMSAKEFAGKDREGNNKPISKRSARVRPFSDQAYGGAMWSTKEKASDSFWLEIGAVEGRAILPNLDFDFQSGVLEGQVGELRTEGAVVRLVERIDTNPDPELLSFTFVAPLPMAARVADPTAHGTVLGPGIGSPDVLIEGAPAWRGGIDQHVCSLSTPAPHGVGSVAAGTPEILINGWPAARAGDAVIEPGGGPNPILKGAPLTLFGEPAPPVAGHVPEPPQETPWFDFVLESITEFGSGRAEAKAAGKLNFRTGQEHTEGKLGVLGALIHQRFKSEWKYTSPLSGEVVHEAVDFSIYLGSWGREISYDDPKKGKKFTMYGLSLVGFEVRELGRR